MKLQNTAENGMYISTVLLPMPKDFDPEWETMVFLKKGDWADLFCWRYDNEEDARKGHEIVLGLVNSRVMEEAK